MMDVALRGETALNVAEIRGKYGICARRAAHGGEPSRSAAPLCRDGRRGDSF